MMTDLETVGLKLACGGGITKELADGTWVAAIGLDDLDGGLYASGATEGHALEALKCKLKALSAISAAAFAEAESRYQVRRRAAAADEGRKLGDLMREIMGQGKDEKLPGNGDN